ncbi:hypothetical protein Tco_0785366 [Tanacetum coccineum]
MAGFMEQEEHHEKGEAVNYTEMENWASDSSSSCYYAPHAPRSQPLDLGFVCLGYLGPISNIVQGLRFEISVIAANSTSKMSFSLARNDSYPPPLTNTDRLMLLEEMEGIIYESIIQCFPELDNKYINVSPLQEVAQKKYGDYTWYAIDVEPIPLRNRNNREVHLDYLKLLKESVETFREIVEEAKVERPLDSSLVFACLYTKHSQELLEYVIGTCLKDINQRDKNHAATPLTRKKQVTFEDQCETSNSNTHKHVEQVNIQKTNVLVPPSTGVNSCTDASESQLDKQHELKHAGL